MKIPKGLVEVLTESVKNALIPEIRELKEEVSRLNVRDEVIKAELQGIRDKVDGISYKVDGLNAKDEAIKYLLDELKRKNGSST